MKKTWLLLAIGAAIGYSLGFKDAQTHEADIIDRAVARLRGAGERYSDNVDKAMERIERR